MGKENKQVQKTQKAEKATRYMYVLDIQMPMEEWLFLSTRAIICVTKHGGKDSIHEAEATTVLHQDALIESAIGNNQKDVPAESATDNLQQSQKLETDYVGQNLMSRHTVI